MLIEILIPLFYIIIFSLFVYKCTWFSIQSVSKKGLLALFAFKIIAAFFYVYSHHKLVNAGDIFEYFNQSVYIFEYLKRGEVLTYAQLTFGLNNVEPSLNIQKAVDDMGFWHDTSAYFVVRFNTLVNLFTFGKNIYANAVFFAFISFISSLLLYRIFEKFLLKQMSIHLLLSVFLTPSILYWTSGMHKETLSVFFITILLYSFFKIVICKRYIYIIFFLVAFLLLFTLRYFIALMLLPPLVAFLLYRIINEGIPILYYIGVYVLVFISMYSIPIIFKVPNIVDLLNHRKELYLALKKGNTAIDIGEYDLSYLGYIAKVPQALINTSIRPYFFEANTQLLKLSSIDSIIMTIIVFVSIVMVFKLEKLKRHFIYIFYSFGFSYLILTGLIVPNIGAILRYRSVAIFLLIPASVFTISSFLLRKS